LGKDQEHSRTNKLFIFKETVICKFLLMPIGVQGLRSEEEEKDKEERETNALNSGPLVLCIACKPLGPITNN
jgi:hypothetical protein